MQAEVKYIRYAHAEGHTAGCFTHDGAFVVTCGSDCDVRKWSSNGDGDDDDDGPSTITLRESATCIVFSNDTVYLGSGNFVETYKYPVLTSTNDRPLRFSAPVTDVDISSDGEILVAGSCDMKIKIKNLKTGEIAELTGHTAPILRVVLDPSVKYLASSSCDGSVKVWDISANKNIKSFNNVIPTSNDFFTAKSLGGPAWERQKGLYLAVISGSRVCIYSVEEWSLAFELSYSKINRLISLVSFSPCGTYLCAGTTMGEIAIWNFISRHIVSYMEHPQKACVSALSWNPRKMDIAYCDRLGRICIVSPKLNQLKKDNLGDNVKAVTPEETYKDDIESKDKYDSEDNENAISISEIKASTGYLMDCDDKSAENDEEDQENEEDYGKPIPKLDLQLAFQPSSTPSHFQHGYMVWNSIGIVRSFNSETESSIDVEFHDTMLHHSIHRRNLQDYFLASLSSKVLCLASSSILTGVNLNAWDEKKEWNITMPEEENIMALAASGNWVCCATDANQLRIFTFTGTQRQVVSLPGPVVCMNSHRQLLIVVTHIGLGLPEYQHLGYIIFDISDFFIRALTPCQPVPLSPKAKLKWTGFTDEGTACTYDSAGIVRLSRDFMHWEVVCDTRLNCKNKSDNYFLIGVSERLQSVRCILCKGSWYPLTAPRPTVVELPLKIPLCEPEEDKTLLEDTFWRHVCSLSVLEELSHENDEYAVDLNNWEKLLKQTVIKLFAEAYRHRADMRAVNIASLMSQHLLQMAVRLVQGEGRMYLVDKLNNLNPKDWKDLRRYKANEESMTSYSRLPSIGDEEIFNSEKRNKYSQKTSQGDMFEDSQPSPSRVSRLAVFEDKNDSSFDEKNSPRVGSPSASITPNPFKVNKKEDVGLKGLNFFNNVKQSNLKPVKSEASDKISKAKQVNTPKEKPSQAKKITFVEWFNKEKKSLQSKYSDLNSSELAKVAMKIFREEVSQGNQKQKRDEFLENNETLPEAKRQKLIDEKNKIKTTVSEKLSAFNFLK